MKTLKLTLVFALAVFGLSAQSLTPNTTLCAAVTSTATSICLTATTGTSPGWSIVNQTGIYVDNEYMLVLLSNSQTVTGSSQYVPVSRGNRAGTGAPTAHNNSAVAWIATTPSNGTPGENGFAYGTNVRDTGPCVRANSAFLPHILVDLSLKRDCVALPGVTTGTVGNWVDYFQATGDPQYGGPQLVTTNGALSVSSGYYLVTKAGVEAMTLAAPTAGAQDGLTITIQSTTANAHTLTATGLLQVGTASVNLATFAAQAGAGLVLRAYNGKWVLISSVGITFS